MSESTKIVSKVLIHEFETIALTVLKDVCIENNLVGLKVTTGRNSVGLVEASNDIHEILESNVELGAIFLTEAEDENGVTGIDLCLGIHQDRPELPIFLRRTKDHELPKEVQTAITGYYSTNNIHKLNELINEYICNMYYPVELAQGFQDISIKVLGDLRPGSVVRCDYPYLVKDQIIYGELFSLIPLESDWCRGYMMLQTTENEMFNLVRSERTYIRSASPNRADINSILNEATNMIWGSVKSRYFMNVDDQADHRTHVPIIVNHQQKHISFGSTEPQLCFKYTIHDPEHNFQDLTVHQRLIFNLSWSPEKFAESDKIIEELVDGGDLEFF
jgi:hypothetical protein